MAKTKFSIISERKPGAKQGFTYVVFSEGTRFCLGETEGKKPAAMQRSTEAWEKRLLCGADNIDNIISLFRVFGVGYWSYEALERNDNRARVLEMVGKADPVGEAMKIIKDHVEKEEAERSAWLERCEVERVEREARRAIAWEEYEALLNSFVRHYGEKRLRFDDPNGCRFGAMREDYVEVGPFWDGDNGSIRVSFSDGTDAGWYGSHAEVSLEEVMSTGCDYEKLKALAHRKNS